MPSGSYPQHLAYVQMIPTMGKSVNWCQIYNIPHTTTPTFLMEGYNGPHPYTSNFIARSVCIAPSTSQFFSPSLSKPIFVAPDANTPQSATRISKFLQVKKKNREFWAQHEKACVTSCRKFPSHLNPTLCLVIWGLSSAPPIPAGIWSFWWNEI